MQGRPVVNQMFQHMILASSNSMLTFRHIIGASGVFWLVTLLGAVATVDAPAEKLLCALFSVLRLAPGDGIGCIPGSSVADCARPVL